jgi:hypothetical protein
MADNTTLNPGVGGDVIATDDIAGVKYQRIKIGFGEEGTYLDVSDTDPLPVLGPLTDAELRGGGDCRHGRADRYGTQGIAASRHRRDRSRIAGWFADPVTQAVERYE